MGKVKHGHAMTGEQSPEYRTWGGMRNRCEHPTHKDWKRYGGRGIAVCDRWVSGDGIRSGFECFLADMGPKPSRSHSIERTNNDLGYSPDNCTWATKESQAGNKANTIVIAGMNLRALAEQAGIPRKLVAGRYYRGIRSIEQLCAPRKPSKWDTGKAATP